MVNFNTQVPTMKWEFGYWGETINNWYQAGLPKKNPAQIPTDYTSPTASLYTKSWTCKNKFVAQGEYPKGMPLMAGGLYWPTQGFPIDFDVRNYFGMDQTQQLVDLNLLFYPMFKPEVLEESETQLKYLDIDGVIRLFLKESATMASGWDWPIKDAKSWQQLKDERINLNNVRARLPQNWSSLVQEYKNRDYPLALGGYPFGFFGTLAHLIGYENLFYMYYDDPKLIHDIMDTFTELWIAVFAEVLADVEIDHLQIWEDISFGSGSMLSVSIIREFMLPYYKRVTGFLKSHGVKLIFVDTDGYCMDIIPLFIEGGATGMFPFEVNCGMDIVEVRKRFPDLALMGGIPKSEIVKGKQRIDEILAPVQAVLKTGGYIPFGDHFIPPDVPWEGFKYYRNTLNRLIDGK
jgi:uroporphyrinogen-III decarboxylase